MTHYMRFTPGATLTEIKPFSVIGVLTTNQASIILFVFLPQTDLPIKIKFQYNFKIFGIGCPMGPDLWFHYQLYLMEL